MSSDLSETFSQISAAGQASMGSVNVSITSGGNIIGQGVTASARALTVSGGNLDAIIESFGGDVGAVQGGGKDKVKNQVSKVMDSVKHNGSKLDKHLDKQLKELHDHAVDLEEFAVLAKSALKEPQCSDGLHEVLNKIVTHVDSGARAMRSVLEKDLKQPKQKVSEFLARNKQFTEAIRTLGAHMNEPNAAGMVSLSFSNVNELHKMGKVVEDALKSVRMTKKEYLGQSLANLDRDLTQKLDEAIKNDKDGVKLRSFLQGWKTLLEHHGHSHNLANYIKGAGIADGLADRLRKSRDELKHIINKFIDAFSADLNHMVSATNELSKHLGKDIPYTDETTQFLDAYIRLKEYLSANKGKFYQHLLEINMDQVDSKELKSRFINNLRVLSERALAMSSNSSVKAFAASCESATESVHKFSDLVKTFREERKKEGGNATDTMNELYSVDASKIEISTLVNSLENLSIAIKKLQFFKNIAIFRSNLHQTNKELAVYSKDYETSVGKSIGEAISRITNEYTEIINQVSDNKSGMGLEIDMYNESLGKEQKISKEKLKLMYKWQCDARVGLYKTIEAIDLYLLHFTDAITKNPDAVSDLHKLLAATRIIARWYDQKAGENLIRVFESFQAADVADADAAAAFERKIEGDNFATAYAGEDMFADLQKKLGGEQAAKVYERCRRAVQGVVVLKNIISYFISLGEKYGDMKTEKSLYMAPSNIYKNLVNYIWVSALDINTTGTEVLTDNNETKRLLTYEDTKVKLAEISDINPETMGINFNRHSIDKLRILKCHNELLRLREFTASMTDLDVRRVKQFVAATFARLGKTKYIFPMFLFGVYDLSQMDRSLLTEFIQYIKNMIGAGGATIQFMNGATPVGEVISTGLGDINPTVAALMTLTPDVRSNVTVLTNYNALNRDGSKNRIFVNLKTFMSMDENAISEDGIRTLNALNTVTQSTAISPTKSAPATVHSGFLRGFLVGLTRSTNLVASASLAQRTTAALHYCVMDMLNTFKRTQSSSVFAIDDTYFVLTIKAVAGKVMTIAGVNSLFKDPGAYRNTISNNKTRIIMGGADSILEDPEVIDDAVELYVRVPLLLEFYRSIFDNANKDYKSETVNEPLDEEQISFVPEIGNVWSNLIKNIFDKSKHIENGVYTPENMRKIVSEINAIYTHYKSSAPSETLTRHIIMELVAEINRRYGVIKRQELLNYYKVMNSTKRNQVSIGESSYTNNDFDILNDAIEFEEKAPSDAFLKLKSTLADSTVSTEVKVNKLTDYKILKDFRDRINSTLTVEEKKLHTGDDAAQGFLTMVDRIRMLKKAVAAKTSRDEKYDMIIKAIEESEAMNQSSNDIFACFHEMVIVPMRMTYHLYKSLDQFILAMYSVFSRVSRADNPILQSKVGTGAKTLFDEIKDTAVARELAELSAGGVFNYGQGIAKFVDVAGATRTIQTAAGGNIADGTAQILLTDIMTHFCQNSGDLVKMSISTTGRITIDMSAFQTLCEYLISNTKFMIDKFTGLVPTQLIENVTSTGIIGSVFWLENNLINRIFNKINKNERERDIMSIDNLNKIMPLVSDVIFNKPINCSTLITELVLKRGPGNGSASSTEAKDTMPIIRDAFMQYSQDTRIFMTNTTKSPIAVFNTLFTPKANLSLDDTNVQNGLVQEFNTLIAHYLNDLYDAQSRKMYPKLFERFANNAFIEALNGQAFSDFAAATGDTSKFVQFYDLPKTHGILSATLAYAMKTMCTRTHPISGIKIHEVASIQEVSAHVLEKYRACLPMYLRLFGIFLERCKFYRKAIAKMSLINNNVNISPRLVAGNDDGAASVEPAGADPAVAVSTAAEAALGMLIPEFSGTRENASDAFTQFASKFGSIDGSSSSDARDKVLLFIDDMVNGISSLLEDAKAVHKELRDLDNSVPLFFDVKHNFTKSFYLNTKELPYAPLSTLTMGLNSGADAVRPFPSTSQTNNFKFLYGMQSVLIDNFKLTTTKVPYMKKLLTDFNGYNTKINTIGEDKFNDMLKYLGQAFNFYYDWKYFNGKIFTAMTPSVVVNTQQELRNAVTAAQTALDAALVAARAAVPAIDPTTDAGVIAARDALDTASNAVVATFSTGAVARLANIDSEVGRLNTEIDALNDEAALPATPDDRRTELRRQVTILSDRLVELGKQRTDAENIGLLPNTYQEVQSQTASLTLIESINPIDSKNKVADFVKKNTITPVNPLISTSSNPRARVIMVNIIDLGIVPINVHSLMREIPLTNLYNYAMTFDQFVDELATLTDSQKKLLTEPYARVSVTDATIGGEITIQVNGMGTAHTTNTGIAAGGGTSLRFLSDIVFKSLAKPAKAGLGTYKTRLDERLNSKLLRNLTFLTLVQYAIKMKVKKEMDFINSRVVSNVAVVSDVITNASDTVNDSLFEF